MHFAPPTRPPPPGPLSRPPPHQLTCPQAPARVAPPGGGRPRTRSRRPRWRAGPRRGLQRRRPPAGAARPHPAVAPRRPMSTARRPGHRHLHYPHRAADGGGPCAGRGRWRTPGRRPRWQRAPGAAGRPATRAAMVALRFRRGGGGGLDAVSHPGGRVLLLGVLASGNLRGQADAHSWSGAWPPANNWLRVSFSHSLSTSPLHPFLLFCFLSLLFTPTRPHTHTAATLDYSIQPYARPVQ